MPHALLGPGPEFDLIRRFLSETRPAGGELRVAPGDDAAVLAGGIVLSTDLSVEGIHFRREWMSSYDIGWRSAAGALSDLAAMAARAIGLLASLAVSREDAEGAAVEVMRGVEACVSAAGGVLMGGDLTRSPAPLILDVVVVGMASDPVLRSSGRPGDELWVTGELGGAAAGVEALLRGDVPPEDGLARITRPVPRIAEALWLAERGLPRSMIDLSDGLAGDVGHIAAASGTAAVLDPHAVPIHPAARAVAADREAALRLAVSGGEDYELCFSAPPGSVSELVDEFRREFGIPLTRVGTLDEGAGVAWLQPDGSRQALERGGYQHFGDFA